jgi:hypothetical protein
LDDDPGCNEELAAQFEAMKAAKAAKREEADEIKGCKPGVNCRAVARVTPV